MGWWCPINSQAHYLNNNCYIHNNWPNTNTDIFTYFYFYFTVNWPYFYRWLFTNYNINNTLGERGRHLIGSFILGTVSANRRYLPNPDNFPLPRTYYRPRTAQGRDCDHWQRLTLPTTDNDGATERTPQGKQKHISNLKKFFTSFSLTSLSW